MSDDGQLVELAHDIFQRVSGPHITFIDPRKHNNTGAIIENAYSLYKLFRLQGVPKENIVISVCSIIKIILKKSAYLPGVCHLTSCHRFQPQRRAYWPHNDYRKTIKSMSICILWAACCMRVRVQRQVQQLYRFQLVTWVSFLFFFFPFLVIKREPGLVPPYIDFHPKLLHVYERDRAAADDLTAHPGIQAIQSILAYFRFNGIKTKVIGTSFRNVSDDWK